MRNRLHLYDDVDDDCLKIYAMINEFLSLWSGRWKDYDIEISKKETRGQIIQSRVQVDWEFCEACSQLDLRMSRLIKDKMISLSVYPCFLPED